MRREIERGFTLIEVLVAIAIISVGVLALGANTTSISRSNRLSANTTIAVNLAQEKLEEAKAQRTRRRAQQEALLLVHW
jgi:type IV pilus modification protein PilV